jgi:hypothetical protein
MVDNRAAIHPPEGLLGLAGSRRLVLPAVDSNEALDSDPRITSPRTRQLKRNG